MAVTRAGVVKRILIWGCTLIIVIAMVLPFFYMASGSFKTEREFARNPLGFIPQEPTLENFSVLFERIPFWRQFSNSLFIAAVGTVSSLIACALVAYGFSRFIFPGKKILFLIMISTLMIPPQVLLVPQFKLFLGFGWMNTYYPMLLPSMVSAFFIYLIKQVMDGVPKELYESAMIDGAQEFFIFQRVAIPLSKSALGIVAVLRFMGSWNDFFTPLLYLNQQDLMTLPVGLASLRRFTEITYGIPLAGALISSIPVLILLSTAGNKYFIEGMTAGALKG